MKPRRRRCSARSARIPRRPWRKPPSSRSKSNRGAPRLSVILTERIPFHDCLDLMPYARSRGCTVIGPNCPGLASPGQAKMGIMPNQLFKEGDAGVISRSGTLTYEIVNAMTEAGFGQTTCIGIGGDPIIGTSMVDAPALFPKDRKKERNVVVGGNGGAPQEGGGGVS